MNLQNKVLGGYIFLIVLISFMVSIVVHERQRISEIGFKNEELLDTRYYICITHQSITTLSILGENIIDWEEADYRQYHIQRLRTDSLLQALKPYCRDHVQSAQIDTLRTLLAEKETHLLHLTKILASRDEEDSLFVDHLPEVARRLAHTQRPFSGNAQHILRTQDVASPHIAVKTVLEEMKSGGQRQRGWE